MFTMLIRQGKYEGLWKGYFPRRIQQYYSSWKMNWQRRHKVVCQFQNISCESKAFMQKFQNWIQIRESVKLAYDDF